MNPAPKGTNGGSSRPGAKGVDKGASGPPSKSGFRLWPVLITVGLVFVVVVNAIFIFIAVSGADNVVPSYQTEQR
jgi:hypothetical protein